mmetsp:Transcript_18286/g.45322  ORF Transcript_18286/g.45322 Transcript_18286/m.45322 type:complete len:86 (+) Transcript_18286:184-441(+)
MSRSSSPTGGHPIVMDAKGESCNSYATRWSWSDTRALAKPLVGSWDGRSMLPLAELAQALVGCWDGVSLLPLGVVGSGEFIIEKS